MKTNELKLEMQQYNGTEGYHKLDLGIQHIGYFGFGPVSKVSRLFLIASSSVWFWFMTLAPFGLIDDFLSDR